MPGNWLKETSRPPSRGWDSLLMLGESNAGSNATSGTNRISSVELSDKAQFTSFTQTLVSTRMGTVSLITRERLRPRIGLSSSTDYTFKTGFFTLFFFLFFVSNLTWQELIGTRTAADSTRYYYELVFREHNRWLEFWWCDAGIRNKYQIYKHITWDKEDPHEWQVSLY